MHGVVLLDAEHQVLRLCHPLALSLSTLIGPDNTGAQNLMFSIQQDHPMHLPGETNPAYVRGSYPMPEAASETATKSDDGCLPPILWVLFCPARRRLQQWILHKITR